MAERKKISAEEAAKRGLVPKEEAPRKKISVEQAAEMGLVPKNAGKPKKAPGVTEESNDGLLEFLRRTAVKGAVAPMAGIAPLVRDVGAAGLELNTPAQTAREQVGSLMAAQQGVLYNASPRIAAGFEAVKHGPGEALARTLEAPGGMDSTLGASMLDEYDRALPAWQQLYSQATEEQPAALVGGALLSGNPAQGLKSIPARVGATAAGGVIGGALGAEPGEAMESAAMGGLVGAAGTAAAEGVGALAQKAAGSLRGSAEMAAPRAAGMRAGISDQAQRMGIENEEDFAKFGRQLLDKKLIPFGGTPDGVGQRAQALVSNAGARQQSVLNDIRRLPAPEPYVEPGLVDFGGRADFDEAAADAANAAGLWNLTTVAEDKAGPAINLVTNIARQGERTPGSFVGLNRAKSDAYDAVNWDAEAPLAQSMFRKATGGIRQSIEKQVGRVSPEKLAELKGANDDFGVGMDALTLAKKSGTREAQKASSSLPEKLALGAITASAGGAAGGLGGAAAGGIGGLAASFGVDLVKSRGPATWARTADAGGSAAEAIGEAARAAGSPQTAAAAEDLFEQYFGRKAEDNEDMAAQAFKALAP